MRERKTTTANIYQFLQYNRLDGNFGHLLSSIVAGLMLILPQQKFSKFDDYGAITANRRYAIMKKIPIRHIRSTSIEPLLSGSFAIRDVSDLLAGKDLILELHRHDYYYVLALKKGKGKHEIDFTAFPIHDHSLFFLRPGNVHQLTLKAGRGTSLCQNSQPHYARLECFFSADDDQISGNQSAKKLNPFRG